MLLSRTYLHVAALLPWNKSSCNLILETCKNCGENPHWVEIGQTYEALYVETQVCFLVDRYNRHKIGLFQPDTLGVQDSQ
jgi:hypothetical protein